MLLTFSPSSSVIPLHPQDVIINFNRTTNNWALRHVYKRLQPLQSKLISRLVTLVFLSLWHGLHIGYIINFSFELPAVLAEQKVCRVRVRVRVGRGSSREVRLARSCLYGCVCAPLFSRHSCCLLLYISPSLSSPLSFPLPLFCSSSPIAGCLLSEDCRSPSLSAPSPAEGPSCCSVDPDEVYLLTLPVGLLLAPQVERLLPGEWVM